MGDHRAGGLALRVIRDPRWLVRLETGTERERVTMTAWDQMNDARKHFFSLWVACGFVAFACSVAAFSGVEALRWIAVIFGLLSAHALTAWTAMGRIADLQAALDMKRMALDMKRGQKMRLAAGDDVDLFGHALVRFHNSAEIEIIR